MSLVVRKDQDTAQWLIELIGEWWPTTTEQRNTSTYLTPRLAMMILEQAVGLEREQVEAKLAAMRRSGDRYPGHAEIGKALANLRRSSQAGSAVLINEDFRQWCADAVKSPKAMVVYDPSLLAPDADVRVTAHTSYWLERAARLLLHRLGKATDSADDVHVWHAWNAKEPQPETGDPHFARSATHPRPTERFLLGASNVVGLLGVEKVHWAAWVDQVQPRLFEPFQWRQGEHTSEFPCDPSAVKFYDAEEIEALRHKNGINYEGTLRRPIDRKRARGDWSTTERIPIAM